MKILVPVKRVIDYNVRSSISPGWRIRRPSSPSTMKMPRSFRSRISVWWGGVVQDRAGTYRKDL